MTTTDTAPSRFFPVLLIAIVVFLAGCAGDTNTAANIDTQLLKPAAKKAEPAKAGSPHKSVFAVDRTYRDPFFPQSKKSEARGKDVTNPEPPPSVNVASLLSSGLQGIGGAAESRIAIINNIMLERGRVASIPVQIGNQDKSLVVRCREVSRDAVVLEVEGYGLQVITLKKTL